jgi:hypothetical protein
MSSPPPSTETPGALRHIWPELPNELQQRIVRLLTQLAYAGLRQKTHLNTQEIRNDHPTR